MIALDRLGRARQLAQQIRLLLACPVPALAAQARRHSFTSGSTSKASIRARRASRLRLG